MELPFEETADDTVDQEVMEEMLSRLENTDGLPSQRRADGELSNDCPICNVCMSFSESGFVCMECGFMDESGAVLEDDEAKSISTTRITVRGPDSYRFQKEFDHTHLANYGEIQKATVMREYRYYNSDYTAHGGTPFSGMVINVATNLYHQFQLRNYVKRSEYKRAIMAQCLWLACIQSGFARDKSDAANCLKLRSGTAKGEDFVRRVCAIDPTIDINVNKDITAEWVETIFGQLEIPPHLSYIKPKVVEMVQIAKKKGIGHASFGRSKVVGATTVLLRAVGWPVRIGDVCDRCTIRKNTVERFTTEIEQYQSHFVHIYDSMKETVPSC